MMRSCTGGIGNIVVSAKPGIGLCTDYGGVKMPR